MVFSVIRRNWRLVILLVITLVVAVGSASLSFAAAPPAVNPQKDSVGVQGRLPSPPPTQGATISVPGNGQVFSSVPITVSGICPAGLLVKLFKNNVFAGSAQCTGGSYSIQIDLFSGQNDLMARVYDALDQPGPDSNTVTVTFNDARAGSGPRVTLTSNFAKRGANPGTKLSWPVTLSGGNGPYAISVDWGDSKAPDLISQPFPGEVVLSHVYDTPGVYNIVVKATDKDGAAAFLQLVGVANGALTQDTKTDQSNTKVIIQERVIMWPYLIIAPMLVTSFWLGAKFELFRLRKQAEDHRSI